MTQVLSFSVELVATMMNGISGADFSHYLGFVIIIEFAAIAECEILHCLIIVEYFDLISSVYHYLFHDTTDKFKRKGGDHESSFLPYVKSVQNAL